MNDNIAQFIFYGILAIVVAAAILQFRGGVRYWLSMFRNLFYWLLIILLLVAIYTFRFELLNFGRQIAAALLPGAPFSQQIDNQTIVSIVKSGNDHFEVNGDVNGYKIRFLVDTGASSIVLAFGDAGKIGINTNQLHFNIPIQTANGINYAAATRIDSLKIGEIARNNVLVLVAMQGVLPTNLLGQDFLESLSSYERQGDRLILRD